VLVAGNTLIWAAMMKDMSVRSLVTLWGSYGQRLRYFLFWDVRVKGMDSRVIHCMLAMHAQAWET
jgi:hypothetical protein